jgi:hypothetical protein
MTMQDFIKLVCEYYQLRYSFEIRALEGVWAMYESIANTRKILICFGHKKE